MDVIFNAVIREETEVDLGCVAIGAREFRALIESGRPELHVRVRDVKELESVRRAFYHVAEVFGEPVSIQRIKRKRTLVVRIISRLSDKGKADVLLNSRKIKYNYATKGKLK